MSFDLSIRSLKIWKSIWECVVHFTLSHTFKSVNVTLGLHSQPAPFYTFALVASPRLGLWKKGYIQVLQGPMSLESRS